MAGSVLSIFIALAMSFIEAKLFPVLASYCLVVFGLLSLAVRRSSMSRAKPSLVSMLSGAHWHVLSNLVFLSQLMVVLLFLWFCTVPAFALSSSKKFVNPIARLFAAQRAAAEAAAVAAAAAAGAVAGGAAALALTPSNSAASASSATASAAASSASASSSSSGQKRKREEVWPHITTCFFPTHSILFSSFRT
jgi:hypothetical protein